VLTSNWDGLSDSLIARFYPVRRNGGQWVAVPDAERVVACAVLTEASLEIALNWQSQFENTDTDSQFPSVTAGLQSGVPQQTIDAVLGSSAAGDALRSVANQFTGRSGITRLNSMQAFTGMPPVKITATAMLRAWSDPWKEVEQIFDQMALWALPVELARDASIIARLASADSSAAESLMPSLAPITVAMQYKNKIYSPLVIESITDPLDAPSDGDGHAVHKVFQIQLSTLTAIDRSDWNGRRINL